MHKRIISSFLKNKAECVEAHEPAVYPLACYYDCLNVRDWSRQVAPPYGHRQVLESVECPVQEMSKREKIVPCV